MTPKDPPRIPRPRPRLRWLSSIRILLVAGISLLCGSHDAIHGQNALPSAPDFEPNWSPSSETETLLAIRRLVADGSSALEKARELLEHDNWRFRLAGVRVLANLPVKPAFPGLLRAANDESWSVRQAATTALGRIGDDAARSVLEARLGDSIWAVRASAVDAVRAAGFKGAIERIAAAAKDDPDPVVRERAFRSLTLLKPRTAHPILVEAVRGSDRKKSRSALAALCHDTVTGRKDLLLECLASHDPALSLFAFEHLLMTPGFTSTRHPKHIAIAARRYASTLSSSSLQDQASRVLTSVGEPAATVIASLLSNPSLFDEPDNSLDPARLLEKYVELRMESATPLLAKLATDGSRGVKTAVFAKLASLPGSLGLHELWRVYRVTKSAALRFSIATHLRRKLKLCESDDLRVLLQDPHPSVRLVGIEGLLARGELELLPRLPALLTDATGGSIASSLEAEKLFARIPKFCGKAALSSLFQLLDHSDPRLREGALLALAGYSHSKIKARISEEVGRRFDREKTPTVRQRMVLTLARSATPRSIDLLHRCAFDPAEDLTTRLFAIRKLPAVSSGSVLELVRRMANDKPQAGTPESRVMEEALHALAVVEKGEIAPIATPFARNRELPPRVRAAAIKSLRHRSHPDAIRTLLPIAEDRAESVSFRALSLETLGSFDLTPEAIRRVIMIARSERESVELLGPALAILAECDDPEGRQLVIEIFHKETSRWFAPNPPARNDETQTANPQLLVGLLSSLTGKSTIPEIRQRLFQLVFLPLLKDPEARIEDDERFGWIGSLIQALRTFPDQELLDLEAKVLGDLQSTGDLALLSEENLVGLCDRMIRARMTACAIPLLQQILATPPLRSRRDLQAARRLAEVSLEVGDYDRASQYYRVAAEILWTEDYDDPEEDPLNHRSPLASFRSASLLMRAESDGDLERCLEAAGTDPRACTRIAVHLLANGFANDVALRAAERAVRFDPDDPRGVATLGQIQLARENWEEARETLRRFLFLGQSAVVAEPGPLVDLAWLESQRPNGKGPAIDLLLEASFRSRSPVDTLLGADKGLDKARRMALQELWQGSRSCVISPSNLDK